MTDWELLRQYRDRGSEAAFGDLVDRHLTMVYWTCRRDVGHDQTAEDCTQAVFVLLAQKASALRPDVSIPGWLYNAARLVSKEALRRDAAHQRRDAAMAGMMEQQSDREKEWARIEPLINDALSALSAGDREAVLLRHFYGWSLRDLGERLGLSEDAARKRVSRAIETLRRHLSRKQAPIAGAALAVLLTEQAAKAVPGNCRTATLDAVRSLGTVTAAHPGSAHGALSNLGARIAMTTLTQKLTIAGLVLILSGAVITPFALKAHAGDNASSTNLTFSDKAQIQASPGTNTSSVRSEIDSDYGARLDKISRRDPKAMAAFASPDFTMTYLDGHSATLDGWTKDAAHFFHTLSSFRVEVSVTYFQIKGNDAYVQTAWHVEGVVGPGAGAYTGGKYVEDRVHQDVWELRSGSWLNISTRLAKQVATVNGQPAPN